MKVSAIALLALPMASGFAPVSRPAFGTSLASSVVTGPGGKAAASKEEDIMLTLKIIMDHAARSTTVSEEQYVAQMTEMKNEPAEPEVFDVSVPYDAAARNAYEASNKSMDYAAFKAKYEADAVADVIAKQPKKEAKAAAPAEAAYDVSVPYDAAAMLAYEKTDKTEPFEIFKVKYEEDAVADVIAKQPKKEAKAAAPAEEAYDVSVPYDAAAMLAYEKTDKTEPFEIFKVKYEEDAVADVIAKQPKKESAKASAEPTVDLSVPYDAAAMLAYEKTDKTEPFEIFKVKYEEEAVADVIAKRAK